MNAPVHIAPLLDDELEQFAPAVDMPLDQGIRRAVLILRKHGFETFESCEGGPGHACPDAIVKFDGNNWEGFRALAVAKTYGLPVMSVRLNWDVTDGFPKGPWWEMTFHATGHGSD